MSKMAQPANPDNDFFVQEFSRGYLINGSTHMPIMFLFEPTLKRMHGAISGMMETCDLDTLTELVNSVNVMYAMRRQDEMASDTFYDLYDAIFEGARRVYASVDAHPEMLQNMLSKMNESFKRINTLTKTNKENWTKIYNLTRNLKVKLEGPADMDKIHITTKAEAAKEAADGLTAANDKNGKAFTPGRVPSAGKRPVRVVVNIHGVNVELPRKSPYQVTDEPNPRIVRTITPHLDLRSPKTLNVAVAQPSMTFSPCSLEELVKCGILHVEQGIEEAAREHFRTVAPAPVPSIALPSMADVHFDFVPATAASPPRITTPHTFEELCKIGALSYGEDCDGEKMEAEWEEMKNDTAQSFQVEWDAGISTQTTYYPFKSFETSTAPAARPRPQVQEGVDIREVTAPSSLKAGVLKANKNKPCENPLGMPNYKRVPKDKYAQSGLVEDHPSAQSSHTLRGLELATAQKGTTLPVAFHDTIPEAAPVWGPSSWSQTLIGKDGAPITVSVHDNSFYQELPTGDEVSTSTLDISAPVCTGGRHTCADCIDMINTLVGVGEENAPNNSPNTPTSLPPTGSPQPKTPRPKNSQPTGTTVREKVASIERASRPSTRAVNKILSSVHTDFPALTVAELGHAVYVSQCTRLPLDLVASMPPSTWKILVGSLPGVFPASASASASASAVPATASAASGPQFSCTIEELIKQSDFNIVTRGPSTPRVYAAMAMSGQKGRMGDVRNEGKGGIEEYAELLKREKSYLERRDGENIAETTATVAAKSNGADEAAKGVEQAKKATLVKSKKQLEKEKGRKKPKKKKSHVF